MVACLTIRITLFLGRIEIEECFFYVSGFFELAGEILYGILLLLCADSKGFFSAQQIFQMLALPPQSFVAVQPFGISQTLIVLVEMETAYAKADSDKK